MERVFLGSTLTIEQLRAVACRESVLAIDAATTEKVKASAAAAKRSVGASPPAATPPPSSSSAASLPQLSPLQSRAALIGICSQICEARSGVRSEVLDALLLALNSDVVRALPASSSALASACASLCAGLPHPLTQHEYGSICALTGGAAGVACLAAACASSVAASSDVAAALGMEAMQVSAACLDAAHGERVRELQAVAAAASAQRLLTEGSREMGKARGAHACFATAAACNGAAAGVITPAARVLVKDLNSAPSSLAHAEPASLPYHAAPIITSLVSIVTGVEAIAAASDARGHALKSAITAAGLQEAQVPPLEPIARITTACAAASSRIASVAARAAGCDGLESVDAALLSAVIAQEAVDATLCVLAAEMTAAESLIVSRECVAAVEAAAKEARRAAAAAARAATLGEDAGRKGKAARKEATDGSGAPALVNVLSLGVGTATIRAHIRAQGVSPVGASADISPASDVLARMLVVASPLPATVFGSAAACNAGPQFVAVGEATPVMPASQRLEALVRTTLDRIGAGGSRREPKIAKGTRDFLPEQMEVREACFNIIRSVFKRHGACEIDTPVFELRETLMGKYGEEGGKLVYDLADQGGELLSLRYDLTVPFARYVAMNKLDTLKRFHIARVYRRDNPAMARGRYREFYQCDYDVAGTFAPMMADAEVIAVGVEILASLPIGGFTLKLNHRGLLDAVLDIAGVPAAKFRPVCSAIDKLDKEPWDVVRTELITEKGIPADVADRIGTMVRLAGTPHALLAQLKADNVFGAHAGANTALAALHTLFTYLEALGALQHVTFDLSLARGLDYYTGVIYEAVLLDPSYGVGSIAAGGRYDHLVGMFSASGTIVPCVGISIGVERVFTIMEAKARAAEALKRTPVSVLVASIPSKRRDMNVARMQVCAELWAAGVSAQFVYADDPKLAKQMSEADAHAVPIAVILGEDEMDRGELQVKDLRSRTAVNVPRDQLVATVKRVLTGSEAAGTVSEAAGIVDSAAAPAQAVSTAVAAPPAATASSTSAPAATTAGTIGVVIEGRDRPYGRFSRPAVSV